MSKYRERNPTSKGLLARVYIMSTKKRSHERDPFSLYQASWIGFFAKILLCCWFHYFLVLSRFSKPCWKLPGESCLRPAPYNTSLHSKFRQTALKLTPIGLDYTQIDTLWEICITDLWFWEVLGQSQSWLRTMQTEKWKLYINSRIFQFLTPCRKIKLLYVCKNVIVFL